MATAQSQASELKQEAGWSLDARECNHLSPLAGAIGFLQFREQAPTRLDWLPPHERARESLVFLQWLKDHADESREELLRGVCVTGGFYAALNALGCSERDGWLGYRARIAWLLAERFVAAQDVVALYRSWGFVF